MTRQQKILLSVLGPILAVVWGRALLGRPGAHPTISAGPRPSSLLSEPAPAGPVPASDGPEWGRDPFLSDPRRGKGPAPSSGEPVEESDIVLNGILWDSKVPSAILNNKVVGRGDRLKGWEVTEIQKDHVVLSDGSETKILTASD